MFKLSPFLAQNGNTMETPKVSGKQIDFINTGQQQFLQNKLDCVYIGHHLLSTHYPQGPTLRVL